MKTVLEEYTKISTQNQNLALENKALIEKQNSMKAIAEQSRLLMKAIAIPAIQGNPTPPFESLPLSTSVSAATSAPAKKRRKSEVPKAIQNLMKKPGSSSTQKGPKVPIKNEPKNAESAKNPKKRPRPDSPGNPIATSSSYWNVNPVPGTSGNTTQESEQRLKTNEAFEQKKRFGKWSDH